MSARRAHSPILFPALSLVLVCICYYFYVDYTFRHWEYLKRKQVHVIRLPRRDSVSAETIYAQLERAYAASDSSRQLERFLAAWHARYRSNADEARRNDTLEIVYSLFEQFYEPWFRLDSVTPYPYIAIQNRADVFLLTPEEFGRFFRDNPDLGLYYHEYYRLTGFRPDVAFNGQKTLYLTPEYEEALTRFLGDEFNPLGTPNIMSPASARAESRKRMYYLDAKLCIIPGHWGGYWHTESHPAFERFFIESGLERAVVRTRTCYKGKYILFQRKKERSPLWQPIDTLMYWIE